MEEEAKLAEFKAQNPDWIPPPSLEEDIPSAKPPAIPSTATAAHSDTALDGGKLHPNVSLIRNKENVSYSSNLGHNSSDSDSEVSPISVVVDQEVNGKVKIMISKKYPKVKTVNTPVAAAQ